MKKLRFLLALWGGKVALWLWKLTGNTQDDKPGMISMRICEDFLARVRKPKLTIVVTGTNGKTTISNMLANALRALGYTVAFNDWGANHHAGQARCLLDAVNIFNRSTKQVAVIETDELTSPLNIPRLSPDYIVINNVARDSMYRNANPEYIRERLKTATKNSEKSVVVLCSDDPVCCTIGENNRRVFFGVTDRNTNPYDTIVNDFPICPVCGGKPAYTYRNYRHIGEFYCESCSFRTPQRDYLVEDVHKGNGTLTIKDKDGKNEYPLISPAIHNIYNTAAIIATLRDLGFEAGKISETLRDIQPPASREGNQTVCGVEIITQLAKTQNGTAVSTVFENINKDPTKKLLLIVTDEPFDNTINYETMAWIYDTDYEFLDDDKITKIVCGGDRYLDHQLRLRLAGIDKDKIVCVPKHMDVLDHANLDGVEKVYVIYDIYTAQIGRDVRDAIKERIEKERGKK